jgi:hypothetical protein
MAASTTRENFFASSTTASSEITSSNPLSNNVWPGVMDAPLAAPWLSVTK